MSMADRVSKSNQIKNKNDKVLDLRWTDLKCDEDLSGEWLVKDGHSYIKVGRRCLK